jgi:transcriptional regulator with XRE-family HTH domain
MPKELGLGKKIKDLRIQKNMNAKELAHMAKISVGMLSQLENGLTQGSVETLRKIAKVLDTTLAILFTDDKEIENLLINDEAQYIVRKADRKKISFPDSLYTCELLVPDLQGEIEFSLIRLSSNRNSDETISKEKGEHCIYVLDGEIVITLNKKEYILQKRDSIRLNLQTPHKIENRSPKKASYISAITPISI